MHRMQQELLNYRVFGNGHPVVFLHGFMESISMWDFIESSNFPFQCIVIDLPGHTLGHVAYYGANSLFCGDTLFSGGCGRIFEGTPAQMLASLDALAALPDDTRVCCAHEYTLSNLRSARAVEPGNADLQQYEAHCQTLRDQGLATLPAQLAQERRINPFLRSRHPDVRAAVQQHAGVQGVMDEVAVFAALREWKNNFR